VNHSSYNSWCYCWLCNKSASISDGFCTWNPHPCRFWLAPSQPYTICAHRMRRRYSTGWQSVSYWGVIILIILRHR